MLCVLYLQQHWIFTRISIPILQMRKLRPKLINNLSKFSWLIRGTARSLAPQSVILYYSTLCQIWGQFNWLVMTSWKLKISPGKLSNFNHQRITTSFNSSSQIIHHLQKEIKTKSHNNHKQKNKQTSKIFLDVHTEKHVIPKGIENEMSFSWDSNTMEFDGSILLLLIKMALLSAVLHKSFLVWTFSSTQILANVK